MSKTDQNLSLLVLNLNLPKVSRVNYSNLGQIKFLSEKKLILTFVSSSRKKGRRYSNKNGFKEWKILFKVSSRNFSQLEFTGSILSSIHIKAEIPTCI